MTTTAQDLPEILAGHARWLRGEANGRRADLGRRVSLYGADLTYADLTCANLSDADLTCAKLTYAKLTRANLHGANLHGANLHGADLHGANLTRADLTRADLSDADLTRADLSVANLIGTNLQKALLSRATLISTKMTDADLFEADFHNANMLDAYLTSADLSGADFTKADLRGADLRDAFTDEHTGLHNAVTSETTLKGRHLTRSIAFRPSPFASPRSVLVWSKRLGARWWVPAAELRNAPTEAAAAWFDQQGNPRDGEVVRRAVEVYVGKWEQDRDPST